MNNVQTLKESLQTAIAKNMAGLKLADVTTERTKRMMQLAEPFANDHLIIPECIEMLAKNLSNPDNMFTGSIIKDGFIYPEILDESMCNEVLQGFVQHLERLTEEGAATIAAITLWCGEEMLKSA